MFEWAVMNDHVKVNPCRAVRKLKTNGGGFPPWTIDDAQAFMSTWKEGTAQRLAFELLLHVGSRRGDLTEIGRQHLRGNVLSFRTSKTGSVVTVELPEYVMSLIGKTKTGDLHFIVTSHGKPFSKAGFGNWFGAAAREAGFQKNAIDYMRIKAFPFTKEVEGFLASHVKIFVVEQNRDAQLRSLLTLETDVPKSKLHSILHYNGLPMTSRGIVDAVLAELGDAARKAASAAG
jgi:hypothetical protein